MKKQNLILSAALVAVFSASTAFAEAEVTGKIVHESAKFTTSGIGIGAATTRTQTADSHGKDNFKQETTAKIYIDDSIDELAEGATYHIELNLMKDGKAIDAYDSNESYTQRDGLREAYVDAEVNDWSIRAGKQQVVWGTADGMKLLDAINPTDYTEMAQNQMEDSRIPVWMVNAEKDLTTGGNIQLIASQAKGHKIAGLNASGDQGHAFVMKGVDSITGKVNGFYNIAPALSGVAKFFVNAGGGRGSNFLGGFSGATVNNFANEVAAGEVTSFAGLCAASTNTTGATGSADAVCLSGLANDSGATDAAGYGAAVKGGNGEVTNLIQATNAEFDPTNPDSTFEYMGDATFATFANFASKTASSTASYVKDHPSNSDMNLGFRFKDATSSGLNYSFNYLKHYDSNPVVDISWIKSDGTAYRTAYSLSSGAADDATAGCGATVAGIAACNTVQTTVHLVDGTTDINLGTDIATLQFKETLNQIDSVGGSFDTAVETAGLGPIVLRGEFLYDKGVKTPIVNRAKLAIGDLAGAIVSEKGDYFKYVLGADVTALTNMMISAQVIQIRNLDYINETVTPTASNVANNATVTSSVSGARYTGDATTMHLSNSLQKAEENKEFYSLFLSKPFGASGEHRWNNIFMFEENGGKWNRLDAEFSIDDDTQATVEYNKYWGDANTQFGQLEKSSNIQVGVKYSF